MRTVRSLVRTLIAVLLATAGPVLVFPAGYVSAQQVQHQSSRTSAAVSHALTISIDGMSPRYATPGKKVTLRGTLTNNTGSAVSGLSVTAETGTLGLQSRDQMTAFAAGSSNYSLVQAGMPSTLPGALASGATERWSVTFSPRTVYSAGQIEVYPIAVVASSYSSGPLASSRTFLPYWPGSGGGTPLQVSWVLPLIDIPQQGACEQTLGTNSLLSSVSAGGRLGTLLETGLQWAKRDHLTWAIDPALVSDVTVMTSRYSPSGYFSGGFSGGKTPCTGRFHHQPSAAAQTWLSDLSAGLAGQSAFATPYADVDVSALSHARLDADLKSAYQSGRAVAARLLPNTFGPGAVSAGTALPAAWPADGIADSGVLTSLASNGVKTVVLSSSEFPPQTAPDAVTGTMTGIGSHPAVLLADSQLTSLLGSATADSSAGSQFAVTQNFLAQTAVILAAAPYGEARSLVIAPPRNWDPSASELNTLLSMTKNARWLHVARLGKLAAESAKSAGSLTVPSQARSDSELHKSYLNEVQALGASVDLFENLLYQPSSGTLATLNEAYWVSQSSAWRDGGANAPGGWPTRQELTSYVGYAVHEVQLIAGKKVLLTGTSGETPVSARNGLDALGRTDSVQVTVMASTEQGSPLQVGDFDRTLIIPAGQIKTVKMPVHSASMGTSTMRLQLATSNGSPLAWTAQSVSVEVTRFGRALLVIIGGALAILVLTTVYRLRRKRAAAARHDNNAGDTPEAGGTG
jgi:hypothetical protein